MTRLQESERQLNGGGHTPRRLAALAVGLLILLASCAVWAGGDPTARGGLRNFDVRAGKKGHAVRSLLNPPSAAIGYRADLSAKIEAVKQTLPSYVPGLIIEMHPVYGVPAVITARGMFLTPPAPNADTEQIVRNFLLTLESSRDTAVEFLADAIGDHCLPVALRLHLGGNTSYYVFRGSRIPIQLSPRHLGVRNRTPQEGVSELNIFTTSSGEVLVRRRVLGDGIALLTAEVPTSREVQDLNEIRDQLLRSPDVLWVYPAFIDPASGHLLLLTNQILLKVRPGVDAATLPRLLPGTIRLVRPLLYADDEFLLEVTDPKAADPLALANFLAETQPWVEWAQPNFIREYVR